MVILVKRIIFLKELLGDDGVLLVPSHPTVAPYHNQPLTKPLNAAYTAIFNVLGLPVTQVPLGLDPCGVPLGIQVFKITFEYLLILPLI